MIARLFLPIPPSTNHLFVTVHAERGGRRFPKRVKADSYREWIADAGWKLRAQQPPQFEGDVAVSYAMPRNKRRDIDNYAKALNDLLVLHRVIVNDNRIVDLRLKYEATESGAVEVEVRLA